MALVPERRADLWHHRDARGTWSGDRTAPSTLLGRSRRLWTELHESRHALTVFTNAHFRATYRAQALGVLWPIANPTILMIVMTVTFGVVFPPNIHAYPVFLMLGLVPWHYLAHSWTEGTRCLVTHADIVKRTQVPSWVIALGTVASHLYTLAFASLSLLPLIAFYPTAFHVSWALLVLPLLIGAMVVAALGLTLATSVLHVAYRDIGYIVDSLLLIFFWATPIIYPADRFPHPYDKLLLLNPMAAVIHCTRDIVMKGAFPPVSLVAAAWVSAVVLLLAGFAIYRRFGPLVADHV